MLHADVFPADWKKSNALPIHNRESKNLIKNYRHICFLSIFSKVFERLVFNSLFNYFMQYNLFYPCQLRFIPVDSCISQLLSITNEIYNQVVCHLPCNLRGTFLDISKAFGKFWHEGLIFKSKSYCVDGYNLNLLENHFTRL